MSQSISLIIPEGSASWEVWCRGPEWTQTESGWQLMPGDGGGYLDLRRLTDGGEEYFEFDCIGEPLPDSLEGLSFWLISFNNYELCRNFIVRVLAALAKDDVPAWIDNDYGVIIFRDALLTAVQSRAPWDWRRDLSQID